MLKLIVPIVLLFAGCGTTKKEVKEDRRTGGIITAIPHPEPKVIQPAVQAPLGTMKWNDGKITKPQPAAIFPAIHFEFDSAEIPESQKEGLIRNARLMTGIFKDENFVLEGHCDSRGTVEYNLALGQMRADAVRDYLKTLGVKEGRVRTVSYGEEYPFCKEQTEACWATNRRVQFTVEATK